MALIKRTITTILLLFTLKVAHDTDLVHINMINLNKFSDLKSELPYILSSVYSMKGLHDYRFVESMFERFAEAHAQGAVFFGPIAIIPQNNEHSEWIIKDLRGGWGFPPIDQPLTTDPGVEPTLEFVCKILKSYASDLRCKADKADWLISELHK